MENKFSKPQVTIDLDEYNHLKKIEAEVNDNEIAKTNEIYQRILGILASNDRFSNTHFGGSAHSNDYMELIQRIAREGGYEASVGVSHDKKRIVTLKKSEK